MSKYHEDENTSYQLDTTDDDEIEIIEIVGLDEDSPAATAIPEDDPDEIEVSFDDPGDELGASPAREFVPFERARDQEHVLRLRADFDNFKKRVEREREANERHAAASLLKRLLPILDNFERAIAADSGEGNGAGSFREGVLLIFRHLIDELRQVGLRPIDTIGQTFDPNVHEAVATEVDSGLPSHTIVEELQRGYLLHDRVLRPALVKVAMDSSEFATSGEPGEES